MDCYSVLRSSLRGAGATPLMLLQNPRHKTYFIGFPLPPFAQASGVIPCNGALEWQPGNDARRNPSLLSLLYMQHPCIWGAQDTVDTTGGGRVAVLPYPVGGSLHSLLFRRRQRREYLSEAQACSFFCQAAVAVHVLHVHGVVHGNISSRELLLVDDGSGGHLQLSLLEANAFRSHSRSVLTDGGGVVAAHSTTDTPPQQQAPERSAAADIRALGRLLYELCCLELPPSIYSTYPDEGRVRGSPQPACEKKWPCCSDGSPFPSAQEGCSTDQELQKRSLFPPISQRYHSELAELVRLLLLEDISMLPSAAGILELPFLRAWSRELLSFQPSGLEGLQVEQLHKGDYVKQGDLVGSRCAVRHALDFVCNTKVE